MFKLRCRVIALLYQLANRMGSGLLRHLCEELNAIISQFSGVSMRRVYELVMTKSPEIRISNLERQEKSKPLIVEFSAWTLEQSSKVPPKNLLGKAISYILKQWHRLDKYLQDGPSEDE